MARCPAQTTIGKTTNRINREAETFRCEKQEHPDDEAHEYVRDNRTVTWYGPARRAEDNTNYRFGLRPGWQMN